MTIYQNTASYSLTGGAITQGIYTQTELEKLTSITHGTQYTGNASLDTVSTEHLYQLDGVPLTNFVGTEGMLRLFSESTFMTQEMVQDAAKFWNSVAGTEIVKIVDDITQSDEAIHDDLTTTGPLGGQTYNGDGIVFYPNSWHLDALSEQDRNNWMEAVLIHEIGHALGIPHLGGGPSGENASQDQYQGTELMSYWTTGLASSPAENALGVKSTLVDAAALAEAALTWRKPRKVASWVLEETAPDYYALYNYGTVTTNIPVYEEPWGIHIDPFVIKSPLAIFRTIDKNYNYYQFDSGKIDGVSDIYAVQAGNTGDPAHNLIGKRVQIVNIYPTNYTQYRFIGFKYEEREYVILEQALNQKLPETL
ncbi:zinc metalloprotease [Pediococcus pentosaceus]|uniref:hypothetical protein n=1 Tax=Pediococcus pentosaceus TaxID=1255 RepID=UPI0039820EC8